MASPDREEKYDNVRTGELSNMHRLADNVVGGGPFSRLVLVNTAECTAGVGGLPTLAPYGVEILSAENKPEFATPSAYASVLL